MAWSFDRDRAIPGADDNTVRLWDVETGRAAMLAQGNQECVSCSLESTIDATLLSGSDDSTVRLWDVETGQCLRVLEGHTATVASLMDCCVSERRIGRRATLLLGD